MGMEKRIEEGVAAVAARLREMAAEQQRQKIDAGVALIIERVRELAVAGVAPSLREYNLNCGDAPTGAWMRRHNIQWGNIVKQAGLKPASHNTATRADRKLAALEAEIQKMFEASAEASKWQQDRPMEAIPTRIEVKLIPLPNGDGAVRVTRAYASLR